MTSSSPDEAIRGLYERHARAWDRDRGRSCVQEKPWLDRFLRFVQPGGTVLDIGCGMGEPIARYIIDRGFHVTGIDSSPTLIGLAQSRFPQEAWIVGDMRQLALNRRFDGILAWDSFFHLNMNDQRAMFPLFAAHANAGAPLMFTSGTEQGVAMGEYEGEALFHASLDTEEYEQLLAGNGFTVQAFKADDPDCGNHTIWIATHA